MKLDLNFPPIYINHDSKLQHKINLLMSIKETIEQIEILKKLESSPYKKSLDFKAINKSIKTLQSRLNADKRKLQKLVKIKGAN